MEQPKYYDNYPFWMIALANLVSLATYFIGAFILYRLGIGWVAVYLAYIVGLEVRLLKGHCVDCWYYGKYCAFGKGKLSSWFFKPGKPERFNCKQITWKDIVPDFLVGIIPIIAGIVILIKGFDWLLLGMIILLALLISLGSALVRGQMACKHCRQRELGCPAQRLFDKSGK
ncbi:MAG: hypothetical protein WC980_05355 [Candidatus Brocadiia bacterium]